MGRFLGLILCAIVVLSVGAHDLCTDPSFKCELDEIISEREQQLIQADICNIRNEKQQLLVPTVQHTSVDAGVQVTELCRNGPKGYLKWVSWEFYARYLHDKLNFMEKSLDRLPVGQRPNTSAVLLEILPQHYELHNVSREFHRIVQFHKSVKLGSGDLHNAANRTKTVAGKLEYAYERRVRFEADAGANVGLNLIDGLSLQVVNRTQSETELPDLIAGHVAKKVQRESIEWSSVLEPGETTQYVVKGDWVSNCHDLNATLVSVYSVNVNRTRPIRASICETRIANVQVGEHDWDSVADSEDDVIVYSTETRTSNTVYPGFRPYFYLACFVLFGTMFIVFSDVVQKLWHDRMVRLQRKRTVRWF